MTFPKWMLKCFRLNRIHYNVRNYIVEYCKTLQECYLALSYGMLKKLLPPDTPPEEIERQRSFFAPNEHGVSRAEKVLDEMLKHMKEDVKAVSRTRELYVWEICGWCKQPHVNCGCKNTDVVMITSMCQCGRTTTYPSDSPQACSCFQ